MVLLWANLLHITSPPIHPFIHRICLMLSLNKKFKRLWHMLFISVFTKSRSPSRKSTPTISKVMARILLVCNWRYLHVIVSLKTFTLRLSKLSQFNSWVDNHTTYIFKVLCILADIELTCLLERVCKQCLWEGLFNHSMYILMCIFYFQCFSVDIYKEFNNNNDNNNEFFIALKL